MLSAPTAIACAPVARICRPRTTTNALCSYSFSAGEHGHHTMAGRKPERVFSGHAQNYQWRARYKNFDNRAMQTPFIVAGCGGYPLQHVDVADGQIIGDRTFNQSLQGYGYLPMEVTQNGSTPECGKPTPTWSRSADARWAWQGVR